MSEATVRGRFVWHELMTTDTKAAAAFYTRIIGWKTEAFPQDPSYTMWVAMSGPVGGLMILPEDAKKMGAPPHWMLYVGTPDVDVTTWDADRLGAKVLTGPMDIPNVGRFAILQDPQGASFAVYQSLVAMPKPDAKPQLGEFSWHELATTDHAAAFRFYSELFGWEKTESMDMGPEMGVYQMFGWKGNTLGGMYNKPKEMPAPPHWLCYAMVTDARKSAEAVKAAGGQVLNGPMEVPGGDWITQCLDPQGAAFAVHSVTKKPTPAKPAAKKAKTKVARKPKAKAAKKRPAKKASKAKRATKAKAAKGKAAKKSKKSKRR